MIDLAERIERWARRNLLDENTQPQAPEKPTPPAEPTKSALPEQPAQARSEPPLVKGDRPPPKSSLQKSNGGAQWGGAATEKQLNAVFAIGRSKGYDANAVKAEIKEKIGKDVLQLTSREASKLIDDLKAL